MSTGFKLQLTIYYLLPTKRIIKVSMNVRSKKRFVFDFFTQLVGTNDEHGSGSLRVNGPRFL